MAIPNTQQVQKQQQQLDITLQHSSSKPYNQPSPMDSPSSKLVGSDSYTHSPGRPHSYSPSIRQYSQTPPKRQSFLQPVMHGQSPGQAFPGSLSPHTSQHGGYHPTQRMSPQTSAVTTSIHPFSKSQMINTIGLTYDIKEMSGSGTYPQGISQTTSLQSHATRQSYPTVATQVHSQNCDQRGFQTQQLFPQESTRHSNPGNPTYQNYPKGSCQQQSAASLSISQQRYPQSTAQHLVTGHTTYQGYLQRPGYQQVIKQPLLPTPQVLAKGRGSSQSGQVSRAHSLPPHTTQTHHHLGVPQQQWTNQGHVSQQVALTVDLSLHETNSISRNFSKSVSNCTFAKSSFLGKYLVTVIHRN